MLDRPTPQTYTELQLAYDFFNEMLFDGQLPACLITLQREKRTHGYFSSERFVNRDGETYTDEIALNPSYFSVVPPMEIMQTIVHEMVHAWQFHFGNPGRRGYHNREWAEKMEQVGLTPSSTGKPGGEKTGEKMNDYPTPGGKFEKACKQLLGNPDFSISWYDRFPPDPEKVNTKGSAAAGKIKQALVLEGAGENKSNREKLRCPNCGNQAWCKPGMKLLCGEETCLGTPMESTQD